MPAPRPSSQPRPPFGSGGHPPSRPAGDARGRRPGRALHLAPLLLSLVLAAGAAPAPAAAQADEAGPGISTDRFASLDVFELEWAGDPRISPDGSRIVYVRNGFEIEEDRRRADLWIVNADGTGHRPLTSGGGNESSPRWSPDGGRLLYVSTREDGAEIWVRWMDTGEEAKLTSLTESPGGLSWSPDGERIAFSMFVPGEEERLASMPPKPEGADWGEPFEVIDELNYRADGAGYLEPGHRHLFVLPAEGGTPRQVTSGPWDHGGTAVWTPDGEHLLFSANRHEDADYDPRNSEIYELTLSDGSIRALTDRQGPDDGPALSPDGSRIAYTGFDDRYQGYQVARLHVMERDGSASRVVAGDLDRSVRNPAWSDGGDGLYVQYDDEGDTKLAFVGLDGSVETLAEDVGGLSLGRPYSGGTYSVTPDGRFAFTHTSPDHPADVAVGRRGAGDVRRLTRLNADLFPHKELGRVEEFWYESSHDGRRIQGWIVTPPGFDPSREYPMILEIHGGPFANYGDRFSAEVQLYASAGYVVLYTNPRGSTSYGEEFGNLIHHAYPGHDYDDLMSGVDAVLERGFVDEDRLYVTGGSGGGVLTAWIVGKTDRFRAAVSAKPVINWYSFVLTADNPVFFSRYWFPGPPWEHRDHYMDRSPLSLVGRVSTPTMLMTGERDHRTPISETEQYYMGLKLRRVPAAMVRIPDASHGIASRPSNLVGKVEHVLAWFERYRAEE